MKQQLKQILDHKWFFPIILLNYGLFYILFLEKYPASDGFGTDGYVYRTLITQFTQSNFFDGYYIHRIFPSLLIRNFLNVLSIELSPKNIFYCFEFLNLFCLVISAYFIKRILLFFNINFKKQLLAFVLLFVNFATLKWSYYFPAMTDTVAFALSVMLLFAYIKNNVPVIILLTFVLAFTWPMGYYQGILLIAFPYRSMPFASFGKAGRITITMLSVFLFLAAFVYVILINKADTDLIFVPKIEQSLLPYSVILVSLIYFGYARLFFNRKIFDVSYFIESLDLKRIIFAGITFAAVTFFVSMLDLPPSKIYKVSAVLENPIVHSMVRPLLSIVSHYSFFGIALCLIIIFWREVSAKISRSGWALIAAIALNLYLFGIMPESRMLINLFPWLIIFLVYSINDHKLSNTFYIVTGFLCLLASKIWLLIDYEMDYDLGLVTDKNGSLDFPNQRFYMNLGPWMSEKAYYLHGAAMFISFLILFFMIYKITFPQGKFKIQLRLVKTQL